MLPFDDLPFPSEASLNAGASADDSALFELPDVADLEKKRKSRESKRKSKATSDAKVTDILQLLALLPLLLLLLLLLLLSLFSINHDADSFALYLCLPLSQRRHNCRLLAPSVKERH